MTDRQRKTAAVLSALLLVALFLFLFFAVGRPLVAYVKEPQAFRDYVSSHGLWGRLIYLGMVTLQVVVAIIPGEPFELLAGYAFGAWEGTLLALTASFLGGTAVFLLVHKFGISLVRLYFGEDKLRSLSFLKTSPKRDVLFFLLFTIPGTPKDILCYYAGLTDMKLSVWLLIGSVGRIPSIVTSTLLADAVGTRKYLSAALVFAITLCLSLCGVLIYRYIVKRHEKMSKNTQK